MTNKPIKKHTSLPIRKMQIKITNVVPMHTYQNGKKKKNPQQQGLTISRAGKDV